MIKCCTVCKIDKHISEFHTRNDRKSGYASQCKACDAERHRKYPDRNRLCSKRWAENNKERVAYNLANWKENNVDHIREYRRSLHHKKKNDPLYLISNRIRNRLRKAFLNNGYTKKSKTMDILGCDFKTLCEHLENQFAEGMSWDNKSEWHVDHIIPLSCAKSEDDLILLNHYTNLRPLWAIDNLKKGSKLIEEMDETYNRII